MSDVEAFAGFVDLASEVVGGRAIAASDDFFAAKENLLRAKPAAFDPATYTDRGKEMDGWESRRKRVPGHDWCVVRLGIPGRIVGVDVDTAHFLGNHPPFASLDAAVTNDEDVRSGEATWERILVSSPLKRGAHNLHPVKGTRAYTHVRLNVYPDGGVARLRVYGVPTPPDDTGVIDLAAIEHGARPLACSDMFFSPMQNLLLPGRSPYMGNGWETRRSRPPGMDWIVVRLGVPGLVEEVLLDTGHFKGNYPDRAQVDGLWWPDAPPQALIGHPDWRPLTDLVKLRADHEHLVRATEHGPFTHVRLRILPDGGVARMRVFGRPAVPDPNADPLLRRVNSDDGGGLRRCCGSRRWASAMIAARPFRSRTQLLGHASEVWWHLEPRDWLEAFSHHPRIGEKGLADRWASAEQAGAREADEDTLRALADGNRVYENRFGHVFLVCATGLSAAEMLRQLRDRLDHDPAAELRIAAGEQVRITALRLAKLEAE